MCMCAHHVTTHATSFFREAGFTLEDANMIPLGVNVKLSFRSFKSLDSKFNDVTPKTFGLSGTTFPKQVEKHKL